MSVARTIVVTGTDTEVGKTHVASAILRGLVARGATAVGYKPVASGARWDNGQWVNEDALALQAAGSPGFGYGEINPYTFEPPIAPHIAARDAGVSVSRSRLDAGYGTLAARADWVVIEGAGGWHVPLGNSWDFADWMAGHAWPTVLVVGMRLGCVNHALLSARAIAADTALLGWIANVLPPVQPRLEENLATLAARMPVNRLATVATDPPVGWRLDAAHWLDDCGDRSRAGRRPTRQAK